MNNPKISVIIPVYNVESYLRECLDSIVNQTFRDLEIICINDGSTDGSLAILEEYASKDRRFQIVTKENGGQAECRNIGISMASGEYIQFVDSDDYLDLNACQTIYSKAVETQSDMVMFLFHFFGKFEKRSLDDVKFIPSELTSNYDKIWFEFNNAQVVWANLFRRDFLDNNNIRFHNGLYFEDVPFVAKASLLAKRISVIPCPLYYYRQRENSTMNNKQKKNYIYHPQCFQVMFEDILPFVPEDDVLLYLLKYKYRVLYNTYYKIIDKSFRPEMGRFLKQSITDDERGRILANAESFESNLYAFFLKFSGLTFLRWKYNLKRAKWSVFNGIAKSLIPYSPWLQRTLETIDSQRKQIQALQEQLEKSKDE